MGFSLTKTIQLLGYPHGHGNLHQPTFEFWRSPPDALPGHFELYRGLQQAESIPGWQVDESRMEISQHMVENVVHCFMI